MDIKLISAHQSWILADIWLKLSLTIFISRLILFGYQNLHLLVLLKQLNNSFSTRLGCFGVTAMLSWGWLKLRLIEVEVDWSWGWLKLSLIEVEVNLIWPIFATSCDTSVYFSRRNHRNFSELLGTHRNMLTMKWHYVPGFGTQ